MGVGSMDPLKSPGGGLEGEAPETFSIYSIRGAKYCQKLTCIMIIMMWIVLWNALKGSMLSFNIHDYGPHIEGDNYIIASSFPPK